MQFSRQSSAWAAARRTEGCTYRKRFFFFFYSFTFKKRSREKPAVTTVGSLLPLAVNVNGVRKARRSDRHTVLVLHQARAAPSPLVALTTILHVKCAYYYDLAFPEGGRYGVTRNYTRSATLHHALHQKGNHALH